MPSEEKPITNEIEKKVEVDRKINILIFQLDAQSEKFEKVDIGKNVQLKALLYHDLILFFIDLDDKQAYIWEGNKTKPRQKFISAQLAPQIRDKYAIDSSITAVDDGNETIAFKNFIIS